MIETTATAPLTGDALLLCTASHGRDRAAAAMAAGYIRDNGKPAFTDFYRALLGAGHGPAMGREDWANVTRCAQDRSRSAYGAEQAAQEDGSALAALRIARRIDKANPPYGVVDYLPDVGVYVACLASYNAGHLYGGWVDLELASDADDIGAAFEWIIRQSPAWDAEEWAIHDHSGLPGILTRSEWPSIEELARFAETYKEIGERDLGAYVAWCDNCGQIVSADDFRDAYQGEYASGEIFCQELAEEQGIDVCGAVWPFSHIDWAGAWREYDTGGDFIDIASPGGVYIFRGEG